MKLPELKAEAKKRKIKGFSKMKKAELLEALKPAEKPAPKKESSLGNIPFNLVKDFMLEKPNKYSLNDDDDGSVLDMIAELNFYRRMFYVLEMSNEETTSARKKKMYDKYIQIANGQIEDIMNRIDELYDYDEDEIEKREDNYENYDGGGWYYDWGFDVDYDGEYEINAVFKSVISDIEKQLNPYEDFFFKELVKIKKEEKKESVKSKVERRGVDVKEEKRIADEKIAKDKRIAEEKVIEDERIRVQAINDEAYGDVVRCVRTFLLSLVGDSKAEYRQKLKNLINIEF